MLIFHLKKKWFDKVVSGEKTHEYRICNDYWKKRIGELIKYGLHKNKVVAFCVGYPKKINFVTVSDKVVWGIIKTIEVVDGKLTDLAIDKPVYSIEFDLMGVK